MLLLWYTFYIFNIRCYIPVCILKYKQWCAIQIYLIVFIICVVGTTHVNCCSHQTSQTSIFKIIFNFFHISEPSCFSCQYSQKISYWCTSHLRLFKSATTGVFKHRFRWWTDDDVAVSMLHIIIIKSQSSRHCFSAIVQSYFYSMWHLMNDGDMIDSFRTFVSKSIKGCLLGLPVRPWHKIFLTFWTWHYFIAEVTAIILYWEVVSQHLLSAIFLWNSKLESLEKIEFQGLSRNNTKCQGGMNSIHDFLVAGKVAIGSFVSTKA